MHHDVLSANRPANPSLMPRKHYSAPEQLAEEIMQAAENNNVVTVATDYQWYAPGRLSPDIRAYETSIGYTGISHHELRHALLLLGAQLQYATNQSQFFWVTVA